MPKQAASTKQPTLARSVAIAQPGSGVFVPWEGPSAAKGKVIINSSAPATTSAAAPFLRNCSLVN